MNPIIKSLGLTLVGGTIAVSTMTWNGGTVLEGAKSKLSEMSNAITGFKSNEDAMKNKIVSLKDEIAQKKAQLEAMGGENQTLKDDIATLQTELTRLESELAKGNDNITKLEGELSKANAEATALKTQIDNTTATQPMSQAEMDTLLASDGGGTTTPTEPTTPPTEPTQPTAPTGWDTVNNYTGTSVDLVFKNGGWYIVNKTDPNTVTQPIKVKQYNGDTWMSGFDLSANAEQQITLLDGANKLVISSNSGTILETIAVNR